MPCSLVTRHVGQPEKQWFPLSEALENNFWDSKTGVGMVELDPYLRILEIWGWAKGNKSQSSGGLTTSPAWAL